MPVPSAITDLSTTLASNSPAGSDNVFPDLDNYLRAHAQFVALLRDGRGLSTEVSLASAATCDIGGAASMFVQITGTTTITSFGTNYLPRVLRFAGALTLTHNATTLILPTGANITTAAGDMCLAVPVGTSGWRVLQYQRASEGADFVSFLQSGTGASSRTVQSKLRDTVSVLDFGADPTGVADSASAILSACLTGKKVLFPQGTYLVGSTIALTSSHAGCGFVLDGATIKKGFNGTLVTITGCADFTVDGTGKFEGQSATYSGKGFVFSGIGSTRPEFGPGIFINDFAAAHIEIGADAAMYLKTYARIITGSSDLAIDITGTDTSARQRSIYGEIIGYVRLAGTISTFIKPTIVNRVEIASTCSITICSGFSWSNNGLPMTIDGTGTIITGCRFSGDVTLASTMTGVFACNLQTSGTFTNNTTSGNCTVVHDERIEAQNGTTSLPSYSFSGNSDTGIWRRTSNVVDVATGGNTCFEFQNNRAVIGSTTPLAWGDAATVPSITTFDTSLFRQSAGILVAGVGGVLTGSIGAICGKLFPRTDAGAQQTAAGLLGGTGAPNNANGNNGDFYFRSDGGASTTIYHKRAGSWVGVV